MRGKKRKRTELCPRYHDRFGEKGFGFLGDLPSIESMGEKGKKGKKKREVRYLLTLFLEKGKGFVFILHLTGNRGVKTVGEEGGKKEKKAQAEGAHGFGSG